MSKFLVIVESPGKAKTIKKILGTHYLVMASYGHVVDLPKSGLNVNLTDFSASYTPVPGKEQVIEQLKKTAQKSSKVFLCPDSDREGEFIADSLAKILDVPKSKLARCTFNEITPSAINAAIKNPRQVDVHLVESQKARRILDRIVGYKLTNILWSKILRGLSAGRVQSVAVRLVAEREREIQAFKSQEYWTISGNFSTNKAFKADLKEIEGKKLACSAKDVGTSRTLLQNAADAQEATTKVQNPSAYVVKGYSEKVKKESAYPPFHTSSLQQAAANRLGFDASRTMRVAQQLYEGVGGDKGLITYMRTDSFSVSQDAQREARGLIQTLFGPGYCPDKPNYYRSKKGAQQAHECVRPTSPSLMPDTITGLNSEQKRLYDLIWRRFMASQMAPAEYDVAHCELVQDGNPKAVFKTSGRVIKFPGWTTVYNRENKDNRIPKLKVGQKVKITKAEREQHFTQPPPRYNDASLVKKLEAEGVGRPSTYASIIKTIIDRKYVEKMGTGGKAPLKATDLGIIVTESLTDHFSIMDLRFTSEMEERLDEVEEGNVDYKKLLAEFWKDFECQLKAAKTNMRSTKEGLPTDHKCPKCKKKMAQRLSRFGVYYQCEGCEHIMDQGEDGLPKEKEGPSLEPTGIKCDLCGANMILGQGRFGPYLFCEKYASKVEQKVNGKKKKVRECSFTMNLTKKMQPRRKFDPLPTEEKCPKCKRNKMVIRVASRKKEPNAFLSCSGFPKCRNAEPLPDDYEEQGEEAMKTFRANRSKDQRDLEVFKAFMQKQKEEN